MNGLTRDPWTWIRAFLIWATVFVAAYVWFPQVLHYRWRDANYADSFKSKMAICILALGGTTIYCIGSLRRPK